MHFTVNALISTICFQNLYCHFLLSCASLDLVVVWEQNREQKEHELFIQRPIFESLFLTQSCISRDDLLNPSSLLSLFVKLTVKCCCEDQMTQLRYIITRQMFSPFFVVFILFIVVTEKNNCTPYHWPFFSVFHFSNP